MKKIYLISLCAFLICFSFSVSAEASIFTIWTDTNHDGIKDSILGSINGYQGTETGKDNYNYYSSSAHPVNGPSLHSHRLKMFVYERTTNGREFLNIVGGKDEAGHNHWHTYSLDIDITGSDNDPHKVKGDEGKEFDETSEDHFEGDWRFKKNSDGGVIGGLFGNWEAKITFNDSELNRHLFASSGSDNVRIDDELGNDYTTFWISKSNQLPEGTNAVPEPASLLLFASGLTGAFYRGIRKK